MFLLMQFVYSFSQFVFWCILSTKCENWFYWMQFVHNIFENFFSDAICLQLFNAICFLMHFVHKMWKLILLMQSVHNIFENFFTAAICLQLFTICFLMHSVHKMWKLILLIQSVHNIFENFFTAILWCILSTKCENYK